MTDELLEELVQVSVPRRHLIAVYGLLAQLESMSGESDESPDVIEDEEGAGDMPWSVEDLRRFATTENQTSRTIRKVLDVLAAEPGKYFSTSELEKLTSVPRANLKGAFSGLGRHIRKYYPNRVPMTIFAWGTNLGPDSPAEAHYKFDEQRAAAWKEANSAA